MLNAQKETSVMHINDDLQAQVKSASSAELTAILYQGCLNFINAGEAALSQNNYELANIYLQKAQRIINEFRCTLDYQYDISKQLDPLYEYSYNQLVKGNMNSDIQPIQNAKMVITDLKDVWDQVINQVQK